LLRKILAILICKILRFAGKIFRRGSSFPGCIALKIDPNILEKIKMPEKILAVTGSNGKTSTVEIVAEVLKHNKKKIAFNREGSNQIQGIATFVLEDCGFFGRTRSDIFLLELDERFAKQTFKFIKPTHLVILNLYRDQLTRNGNPEVVFRSLQDALTDDITLALNANDPLLFCFSKKFKSKIIWFGFKEFAVNNQINAYDDGKFCSNCKSQLSYETRFFNHVGIFNCKKCKAQTPKNIEFSAKFVSKLNNEFRNKDQILINNKYILKFPFEFSPESFSYNLLAAFVALNLLDIRSEKISECLEEFKSKSMRVSEFYLQKKSWILLMCKHENSVSYDQSLKVVVNYQGFCAVLIIVDAISRKYFTSDTSWLYDIDFYILNIRHVTQIVLSGKYANDLAACLLLMKVSPEKIFVYTSILDSIKFIAKNTEDKIFVMTCFSDKNKFMKNFSTVKKHLTKKQKNKKTRKI
jgi:UDP-N-acetylmuramyl tripeptide synthase